MEFFWSAFSRFRTEYGEIRSISPYLVWMRKNTGHKNSEYGHFSRSERTISHGKCVTGQGHLTEKLINTIFMIYCSHAEYRLDRSSTKSCSRRWWSTIALYLWILKVATSSSNVPLILGVIIGRIHIVNREN